MPGPVRRPSAAMIVSIFALVVAMCGSAVAITTAQNGDSLIVQRTLSGNRLRFNTVTGAEVANLQWHRLNLLHGWTNYYPAARPPAWAQDAQGIVHFRGAIAGGNDAHFATLPPSVRPAVEIYLATDLNNGVFGRVDIDSTGILLADSPGTFAPAQLFTNLDGVTYAP